jgi:Sugar transferases involved in lipopolysaccharide synthesis
VEKSKKLFGRTMKWCFDRIGASAGLVIISPLLLIIAILIKLDSRGPVFFVQKRIGQFGKPFKILKFRTMYKNADNSFGTISVWGDKRVTRLGRFLRKYKIDTLPELFNVLIGQMSFVGPRPDVEGYADKLQGEYRRILELKPGITGAATLKYRNEEMLLAQQADPIRYNDEVMYPDKARINLDYLMHWSLWKDIIILFKTFFH